MTLVDDMGMAETEEMQSQSRYNMMAMDAETVGMHGMAKIMRDMAGDEGRHAQLMRMMHGRMMSGMDMGNPDGWMMSQEEADRLGMGEMHRRMTGGGGAPDRPVPQTYGDWVNLGMDIKEKAGINDFKTTAEVNEHLYRIYKEEEEPETAQVSKMWLTRKAGELGVT